MTALFYTEVAGGLTGVTGRRGTTTAFHHRHGETVGAFVKEDDGPMFYVELGAVAGERGEMREVKSCRAISRDEFDALVDVALVRHSLGWRS